MSLHWFENQEAWEKVHGKADGEAMMTLEEGEEIYKVWVLGVEEEDLQEVKILSKQRKSDGKIKVVIVWEYLDKNKDSLVLNDWFTDEEFLEIAYDTARAHWGLMRVLPEKIFGSNSLIFQRQALYNIIL